MKKVCQRFCTCSRPGGYSLDPDTKQWVCGTCGYPSEAWYMGQAKAGEIPVVPEKRWGKPSLIVDIEKYRRIVAKRAQKARDRVNANLAAQSTERRIRPRG